MSKVERCFNCALVKKMEAVISIIFHHELQGTQFLFSPHTSLKLLVYPSLSRFKNLGKLGLSEKYEDGKGNSQSFINVQMTPTSISYHTKNNIDRLLKCQVKHQIRLFPSLFSHFLSPNYSTLS